MGQIVFYSRLILNENWYYMECWFSGRVQGVGFRYRTCRIAQQFHGVNGRVRNLKDGRVYLQSEGSEDQLLAFKKKIETEMKGLIDASKTEFSITQRPPVFKDFKILRWKD